MKKEDWTEKQDKLLKELATQTWPNRKALFEAFEEELPEPKATQVLYHAIKHVNLKFNYENERMKMTPEAKADALDLLREGYDSRSVVQQIHLTHGILKNLPYYNDLRFRLKRGQYVITKDPITNKMTFEHRVNMRDDMSTVNNITTKKATTLLINKRVTHPHTRSVNNNKTSNLYVATPEVQCKITMINQVTEILGLPFGTLMKYVDSNRLRSYNVDIILKDIFKASGLDKAAKRRFGPKTTIKANGAQA